MISPNIQSENGVSPRLPPNYFQNHKSPNSSPDHVEKTDRVAAMNKITNFSIAAIMNSRNRRSNENNEDEIDDFEAKRRKLAEAVPFCLASRSSL